MRVRAVLVPILCALASSASARPERPKLDPQAAAALAKPALLVPSANQLVPLDGKSKPAPLLQPAPRRLELVDVRPGEALLVVEGDLYRLKDGKLALVAANVGAQPALTPDGALVVSVEDKRALKLTRGGESRTIPIKRAGHWELQRPWPTPDGARVLGYAHDFGQTVDGWHLLVVDLASGEVNETALSTTFQPGPHRQALAPGQVALQLFTQKPDDEGRVQLASGQLMVFDLATRKLAPAPADLLFGLRSPGGRYALQPGQTVASEDARCHADRTLLVEPGKKPVSVESEPGTVVSLHDFFPDDSAVVGSVLDLRTCKVRGVEIPLGREVPRAKWRTIPLPGPAQGARVISPAR